MSPSSPALRRSLARAVICSSAARASAGGSSQPIRAALPVSCSHRSTRVFFAAVSRRSFAFSGAAEMTARAIAARSPAGVSRAARSSTSASAAWASSSSSSAVAPAMISALYREIVPSSSAAAVPGSRAPKACAIPIRLSARARDSPSAYATWSPVNSWSSSPGFRRASSAIAASLRACAWASTRSHPHITPISSASETPPNRASAPAAASAATASPAQPGSTSSTIPGPNAAAGLADSPGNTRAEPGCPGPRRPVEAAFAASSSSAAASSIPASSSEVKGSKFSSSSSSPGPWSSSHRRSRDASNSAAVTGSRSSQARSSSRPGSAGTGDGSMNHDRSEEGLFYRT